MVHKNDLRRIGLCCTERYGRVATDTEMEDGSVAERAGGRGSGRPRSGKGAKSHKKKEE